MSLLPCVSADERYLPLLQDGPRPFQQCGKFLLSLLVNWMVWLCLCLDCHLTGSAESILSMCDQESVARTWHGAQEWEKLQAEKEEEQKQS